MYSTKVRLKVSMFTQTASIIVDLFRLYSLNINLAYNAIANKFSVNVNFQLNRALISVTFSKSHFFDLRQQTILFCRYLLHF